MYAKVDKDKYQKVTANARAAILTGRFSASVIAQLLFSFHIMDLRDLNYLTLGGRFREWTFIISSLSCFCESAFLTTIFFYFQRKQFHCSSVFSCRQLDEVCTFTPSLTKIHSTTIPMEQNRLKLKSLKSSRNFPMNVQQSSFGSTFWTLTRTRPSFSGASGGH